MCRVPNRFILTTTTANQPKLASRRYVQPSENPIEEGIGTLPITGICLAVVVVGVRAKGRSRNEARLFGIGAGWRASASASHPAVTKKTQEAIGFSLSPLPLSLILRWPEVG